MDKTLDLLPPNAALVRTAALLVRPHGTMVLMGGQRGEIALHYAHLMRHGITIKGQYMYPREAPTRLIALLRAGLLSLADLLITRFPLNQANEVVAHAAQTGGPFR